MDLPPRVILFDGDCVVCDAGMTWILDHDPGQTFHFAPLQGPTAAAVKARHPEWPSQLDSIVFVEQTSAGERVSFHSTAIFDIAALLPRPYAWLRFLRVVPAFIRDAAYRAFAAVRYRLFGKKDHCRIPQPHEVGLFLE